MGESRRINFLWVIGILLVVCLQLIVPVNTSAAERVSIITFGAVGNGANDETAFIQKAIDFQSTEGGGTVYFPKGTYKIDAAKSITLKNNITLEFEEGVILKAIPNNLEQFQIMKIHDVKNVNILGEVKIQGERQEHMGTTGEWGMGISIQGSTNIKIENPIISNNWGDGIYIGSTPLQKYSENVKILNPVIDNNRRQGISVISAKNLEIINAVISNTNGTLPQAGIDIEPNSPLEVLEDIKILNLSTDKNIGSGLFISTGKLVDSSKPVSIYVDSTKNIRDGYSLRDIDKLKGSIVIGGNDYLSDKNDKFSDVQSKHWFYSEVLYLSERKIVEGFLNGSFQPNKKTTRAEAAKMLTTALNISSSTKKTGYSDLSDSHWAKNDIAAVTEAGLFNGYTNGSFKPDKNINRAEMAKVLALAYKFKANNTQVFKDVPTSHWASQPISGLVQNKITHGYPDKTFRPSQAITRAEFSVLLARALNKDFR